jgi:hypothetical protein
MGGLEEQISENKKFYKRYNVAANTFRVLFLAGILGYGMSNEPSAEQHTFMQSVKRHSYFLGYEGLCVLGLFITAPRERKYHAMVKQDST